MTEMGIVTWGSLGCVRIDILQDTSGASAPSPGEDAQLDQKEGFFAEHLGHVKMSRRSWKGEAGSAIWNVRVCVCQRACVFNLLCW